LLQSHISFWCLSCYIVKNSGNHWIGLNWWNNLLVCWNDRIRVTMASILVVCWRSAGNHSV